jgi:hypothetical protein
VRYTALINCTDKLPVLLYSVQYILTIIKICFARIVGLIKVKAVFIINKVKKFKRGDVVGE